VGITGDSMGFREYFSGRCSFPFSANPSGLAPVGSPMPKGFLRLDRIVSHTFGITRMAARDKILKGLVRLDGQKVTKASKLVATESSSSSSSLLSSEMKLELIDPFTGNRDIDSWRAHDHLILNKPKATITAMKSNSHKTVIDVLQKVNAFKPRLRPVGRLDLDTTGLLFFTSDGELAHRLMHPTYHIPKTYLVGVQSYVNSCDVERLLHGIRLKDPRSGKTRLARAIDIVVKGEEEARHLHKCDDGEEAANVNYENDEFDFEFSAAAGVVCRVKMTITEGMNRQVRRMFSSLVIKAAAAAAKVAT